ncbi:MAG TPA: hypothetical protein VFT45_13390 [Longimicrobium sp.]|nr:hypothetical protein [Longimicrobium sp.]
MSTDNTTPDAGRRLKMQSMLSILVIVIGILLMIFMITTEDEPGAIPLGLIVLGIGGYLVTRARIRSHHK